MSTAFQRLIVAALCLLAFVLSSESLTQIWPEARLVPCVQAQDAGTPFVLQVEIYRYLNNPDGDLAGKQTIARRSDGSTVLEDNAGPLEWGLIGRKVTFADGREFSVIDALGIKTTWPRPSGEEVTARGQVFSRMQARGCVGRNETLIGHDNISGQDVVVVGPHPILSPEGLNGQPWQLTEWRAADLGCQALVYQIDKKQTDGSLQLMTKSKVVSLTLGEPDSDYFAIPLTYTETKPSDRLRLVYKRVGKQVDDAAIKALTAREDEVYARQSH